MTKIRFQLSVRKISFRSALLILPVLAFTSFGLFAQTTGTDTLVRLGLDDSDTQNVATDSSGNSNDGAISGAVYTAETVDGSPGSLDFDGVDDSVDLGSLDVNGTGLTLAAWIKADSFPGNVRDPRIISKASGISTNRHVFMLSTIRKGTSDETVLRARVRVNGQTATFRATNGELETDVWYHTAMTYDNSTIRLYVNGSEVASTSFPEGQGGPVDIDNSVDVAVGANPNGSNYFDGKIDDVIVAQRVYTAAELLAIADQGALGSSNPPVANPDTYSVNAEQQLTTSTDNGVLANDTDAEEDPLTAILVTDVTNGMLALAADGSFTYTPDSGFTGEDSFTYVANDGAEDSVAATVTLTVDTVTTAPTAVADAYSTDVDTPLVIDSATGVLANDTDAEADPLTAILDADVTDGTLALAADGSFTYTPDSGFTGEDSFTYVANDGTDDSVAATVTLTVNESGNTAPIAMADAYSTDVDAQLVIDAAAGVLANDTDAEADPLTAIVATTVTDGTLALAADGSLTYTPDAGFTGEDSFTYVANDGTDDSVAATVTLMVDGSVNTAPTAVADAYSTDVDAPLVIDVAAGVLANDTDAEADPLTAMLDTNVTDGTLALAADGSFTYTPNAGFTGEDSFTYIANDGFLSAGAVQVSISVNEVNPVSDLLVRLGLDDSDTQNVATDSSGNSNDGAISGAVYTAETVDGSPGSLDFDGVDDSVDLGSLDVNGTGLTLAAWIKADSFPGNVRDPRIISKASGISANRHVFMLSTIRKGTSDETVLRARVRVNGQTATFRATNGELETDVWYHTAMTYDNSTIRLYVNGSEVASTSFPEGQGGPVDIDNSVDVAVGANPNGSNYFDGKIDDVIVAQRVYTAAELLAIADQGALGSSNPPVANPDTYSVNAEQQLTISPDNGVLANDTDAEEDPLTAILVTDVTNGMLALAADGSFTYTPDSGFTGEDSFTYVANDGAEDSVAATVTLTVDTVTTAPTAVADAYSTDVDTPLIIDSATGVLANDTDAEADLLTAILDADVTDGTLALAADGSFTYTPDSGFTGEDSFTYVANDGAEDSAAATVTLNVNGSRNAAPTAVADAYSTDIDTPLVIDATAGVLANDTDQEADPLTATLVSNVAGGTLALAVDGSLTYTPDAGFTGEDSFTYVANDGTDDSVAATVTLTVNGPSNTTIDVFYGANQDIGAVGQSQVWINIPGNVADPDGVASLSYTLNGGAPQTLTVGPDGRRLNNEGDFNIDPARDLLIDGVNEIIITSVDTLGDTTSTTVVVNYTAGSNWPENYQVDWSQVSSINDVAEIIDGDWSITADGVRTQQTGYDRLFAIGDMDWVEYEVVSNFIIHDTDENLFSGVGLIGPWNGHTDDPVAGAQPKTGFLPYGSLSWAAWFPPNAPSRIQTGGFQQPRDRDNFDFTFDQKYNFRYRVEFIGQSTDLTYRMRVWADGSPEPSEWNVQYTDEATDLTNGSLLFIAHYTDATFGNISVEEIQDVVSIPTALADAYGTDIDVPLVVDASAGVLANDSDADADPLTAILDTSVMNGTLALEADGSFTYTPSSGFTGEDSFTYVANDGVEDSSPATVTLTVNGAINTAPTAMTDAYSTDIDVPLVTDAAAGVLANDTDAEADPLTASLSSDVTDGTLDLAADGSFTYIPNTGFTGSDSFTYVADDGLLNSEVVQVSIVVNEGNTNPDLLVQLDLDDDQDPSLATDSSGQGNNGTILNASYDSDTPDGSPRSLDFESGNIDLGSLDVNGTGITLAAWIKADSFPGNVRDPRIISKASGVGSNDHIFMLGTVRSGSDTVLRARLRVNGSTTTLIASTGELLTDNWYHAAMIYDGATLKLFLDGEEVGSRSLSGSIEQDATVSVAVGSQPGGGKFFDGKIDDVRILQRALEIAELQDIVGSVVIPVETLVANDDAYVVDQDTMLSVAANEGVLANDTDQSTTSSGSLTAELVDGVSSGTLLLNSDGAIDYLPLDGFFGTDSFSYRAFNGTEFSQIAVVTLQVNDSTNQVPVAQADNYNVSSGSQLLVPVDSGVLANDADGDDGDTLTATLTTDVSNGSLSFNADGSFSYQAFDGFTGTDNFSYSATDGVANSAEVTVTIQVVGSDGDPDLLTHLEFEDFSTTSIAEDSSIYNNFGAISGASYVADTADGSSRAMQFNDSDFIDLGILNTGGTGLTLAGWFKADDFPGTARDPRIISKASGLGANDHIFMLSTIRSGSETLLRGRVRVNGRTTTLIASSGDLSTGIFYHAAFVYDGSMLKLYLDGVEVGSSQLTGAVDVDDTISVSVGAQPGGGRNFEGVIDDVRILQRALTSQEINEIASPASQPIEAPDNLNADASSGTAIALNWSAAQGAVEYRVIRDGVLVATVTENSYLDDSAVAGETYTYEIVSVSASGELSEPSTITATLSDTASSEWWDTAWNYRIRITVNSADTARENKIVSVPVDLDDFVSPAGSGHDESRVRCVEIDSSDTVIDESTRCQSGDGEVIILLNGDTPANSIRYFHAYFDVENAGQEDAREALVSLRTGLVDDGFNSFEVSTSTGSMLYHTEGGGISSLFDLDGNDWVDYTNLPQGLGRFRGIPNLVPPVAGGYFHPGFTTSSTTVIDEGPIRVRFESISDNEEWRALWDVFPEHIAMTLLEKATDDNFWFLYEGTPGGALDAGDFTVRSTGVDSTLSAFDRWSGDIPDEEWMVVGASEVARSLFFAKQDDDSFVDSYRPLSSDNEMTVLAFGREVTTAQFTDANETFYFGFLDGVDFGETQSKIRSIVRDISVEVDSPETRP